MMKIGKQVEHYEKHIVDISFFCSWAGASLPKNKTLGWGDWTSETYSDMDWEASNATKNAEGTIQEVYKTDYRLIIRIAKNGDNYSVRAKTIKANDSSWNDYHPRLTVTDIGSNRIWLQASEQKRPLYSDGEIDEYCDITWYYTLTLEDGALHYVHYRTHSVNYDKRMRYKDEDSWDASNWTGCDLMLYNDNW